MTHFFSKSELFFTVLSFMLAAEAYL